MSQILHASDYVGEPLSVRQGQAFKPFPSRGYTSIAVLDELKGKPWDDVALGYCHALRPSHIRVVQDRIQLDSQAWRVTVWVSKKGFIKSIEQEVEVGLPENVPNGIGLEMALIYGINSPQLAWENLPGITCLTPEGTYKYTEDGKTIPWPQPTHPSALQSSSEHKPKQPFTVNE